MLSRALRIILMVIALVYTIWPDLIGQSTRWVALIAVVILLIGEFTHKHHASARTSRPVRRSSPKRKSSKKSSKKRR